MTDKILLTFNPGSSTIKIGLYALSGAKPLRTGGGVIDLDRKPFRLRITDAGKSNEIALRADASDDLCGVIAETLDWLARHFPSGEIEAAAHRVVHGGDRFSGPVLLDDRAEAELAALTPLAPLHQPKSLRLVRAVKHLWPGLPQTASFDTAFHRTQSDLVRRFALPRALFDQGIKRYGFHGLSYASIAGKLAREHPELAAKRVVVAHLGSGASLCGLEGGVSRDTSMGFSTLDGVPMATRCGALDPGVILHLEQQMGMSPDQVSEMLYHQSGLLGVSGISGDSRDLVSNPDPAAQQAIRLFGFRIAQEVARLATSLGGVDGVVFTAGIGEHQPQVRLAVAAHLGWLGMVLDEAANAANTVRIDAPTSRLAVLVIKTDEEQVIAEEALSVLPASIVRP